MHIAMIVSTLLSFPLGVITCGISLAKNIYEDATTVLLMPSSAIGKQECYFQITKEQGLIDKIAAQMEFTIDTKKISI
ncbi:hypothetical protein BKA66DRAFT_91333 [Pyrenochaeta sp. MPI-SDFR-AT-0127]|nr:hypothetical protein BKA66DRAFT_91333 [Pyrenochaeta sp. MPI-SDFR-AT-0127]